MHSKLKFKSLDDRALLPVRGSKKSSGLDLFSIETVTLRPGMSRLIQTGLAVELPEGHEAQIRPRSGLAFNHGVTVLNAPGTIDEDYTGELKVLLINHSNVPFLVEQGKKIAQLVLAPVVYPEPTFTEEIRETERGSGGFGSTGA